MIQLTVASGGGQVEVRMVLSADTGPELTFQQPDSLLDVLRVFAPDETPGIFKLGFFGHGSLHQLIVVLLLKFLPKHTTSSWFCVTSFLLLIRGTDRTEVRSCFLSDDREENLTFVCHYDLKYIIPMPVSTNHNSKELKR